MPADQAQQFDVIGVRGVLGFFFEALEQFTGQMWIESIANAFESNQDTETYAGLGMVPAMREWIGQKNAKSFNEFSVKITNRDFEATLKINNKDRRRDKTDQLRARIGELAQRAVAHDAILLSALIDGGQSTSITIPGSPSAITVSCYDGNSFWNTGHTIGNGTLSSTVNNLLTINLSTLSLGSSVGVGTVANPTPAAIAMVLIQMLSQLYNFTDDQGQPLNEFARKFVVMVPPAYIGATITAIRNQFLALGFENPLLNVIATNLEKIELIPVPNPRLTKNTNAIYLFRADSTFKPFIRQYEELTRTSDDETQFGERDNTPVGTGLIMKVLAEGSDYEFNNNAALFSIEKSGMVGFGRFDAAVAALLTQSPL